MEKLKKQKEEITQMIQILEGFKTKWNEIQVPDYQYTNNKFDNLITALTIHRNEIDHEIEFRF